MKRKIICFLLLFSAVLLNAHDVKLEGDKYIVSHEWEYGGQTWTCKIPVSKKLYDYYKNDREHIGYNYPGYAMSEYDRNFIKGLISSFRKSGEQKEMSDFEVVKNVVSFIQSLQYVTDMKSKGEKEYVRFPVETVVDGIGDCEDFSILMAAILDEMGYSVVLLELPDHLAVAVASDDFVTGTYYPYNGKKYYYLETTNPGWDIGDIPDDYKKVSATLLPLVRKPVVNLSMTKYSVTYTDEKASFDINYTFKNYGPLKTEGTYAYVEAVYNGKIIASNKKLLTDVVEGGEMSSNIHLDCRNNKKFVLNIYIGGDNFKKVSQSYDIKL